MVRKDTLSSVIGQFVDHNNIEASREYVLKYLNLKEETPGEYFTKKDGKIYSLVKSLYSSPYMSGDYEIAITKLNSYIGRFYRVMIGCPVGISEKIEASGIRKGYSKCGIPMKIAAWIAVHSYLLNAFIPRDAIKVLIPKSLELAGEWNECIIKMTDIPHYIGAQFVIDSSGRCMFLDENVDSFVDILERNAKREEKKEDDHPHDDPPFDQSTIVKDGDVIDLDSNDKKESKKEDKTEKKKEEKKTADKEFIQSSVNTSVDSPEKDEYLKNLAEEEKKENKKGDKKKKKNAPKEYTFGELRDAIKFDDPNKTAAGSAPIIVQNPEQINSMSEIIGSIPNFDDGNSGEDPIKNDVYAANNKMWEDAFPGLDAFTKLIHKAGYSVQYMRSDKFPELIYVEVIDFTMNNGQGGVKKIFFVDPGLVYGDTMRLVTTDRSDCYILGETYLSKSQPDMIMKAVTTGLSKDDRKKINSNLPRFLHNVLFYVDMRGLQGKMKNFMVWRSFMTNLTKVVRHTPECRFRIMEVENKDKFKLICDKNVRAVTYLDIFNNPEHIRESSKGLVVEYDPEKYGDKNYGMYHLDGTPLDFDPYETEEKKEA